MKKRELQQQIQEAEIELKAIKKMGCWYPLSGLSMADSMRKKWNGKLMIAFGLYEEKTKKYGI